MYYHTKFYLQKDDVTDSLLNVVMMMTVIPSRTRIFRKHMEYLYEEFENKIILRKLTYSKKTFESPSAVALHGLTVIRAMEIDIGFPIEHSIDDTKIN